MVKLDRFDNWICIDVHFIEIVVYVYIYVYIYVYSYVYVSPL